MTTKIQWAEETWNPIRGCTRVSPGCANCYAERHAGRFSGEGLAFHGFAARVGGKSRWTSEVELIEHKLYEPLSWKKPRKVFVNSMSDLFHDKVADLDMPAELGILPRIFAVMAACPQHTFQILTKRPEIALEWFRCQPEISIEAEFQFHSFFYSVNPRSKPRDWPGWPLPNVWIGVSVESQRYADERLPILGEIPAALRFASAEPLLEQLSLEPHLATFLDWLIVGGESGPKARTMQLQWAEDLVRQAKQNEKPVFVKQLGSVLAKQMQLKHKKGGDLAEWPKHLQIRQFPAQPRSDK